jgi:hypothetical protein
MPLVAPVARGSVVAARQRNNLLSTNGGICRDIVQELNGQFKFPKNISGSYLIPHTTLSSCRQPFATVGFGKNDSSAIDMTGESSSDEDSSTASGGDDQGSVSGGEGG